MWSCKFANRGVNLVLFADKLHRAFRLAGRDNFEHRFLEFFWSDLDEILTQS